MSGLEAHISLARGEFELDVQLSVAGDATVALLGPNGAGKSTIVAALAGHLAIDEGFIRLDGVTLDDGDAVFVAPPERGVGVVHQDYLLFDHLDVLDNISFGPRQRLGRRAARQLAEQWIQPLDLGGLEHRRPSQLSGGQAQRVALARALATEPRLLLLDEPLAALDVRTRARLRSVLATHLLSCPAPRLLVTHDPVDALLLAQRVVVVEEGRIVQDATPEEVRRAPATEYVAALAGTNLFTGRADRGRVRIDGHPTELTSADVSLDGAVLVTFEPTAVALYPSRPDGSPRNTWQTVVDTVEPHGAVVRVVLGAPLPVTVDVTADSATTLGLVTGRPIWASVKATEVMLRPS